MPEVHLRQLAALDKAGFTYSTCEPCTKSKERIQNLKKRVTQDIFIKIN